MILYIKANGMPMVFDTGRESAFLATEIIFRETGPRASPDLLGD